MKHFAFLCLILGVVSTPLFAVQQASLKVAQHDCDTIVLHSEQQIVGRILQIDGASLLVEYCDGSQKVLIPQNSIKEILYAPENIHASARHRDVVKKWKKAEQKEAKRRSNYQNYIYWGMAMSIAGLIFTPVGIFIAQGIGLGFGPEVLVVIAFSLPIAIFAIGVLLLITGLKYRKQYKGNRP